MATMASPSSSAARRALLGFILTVAISHPTIRGAPSVMPSAIQSSHTDRVFVASMHWNNELIIRSHWSTAVLDLVKHFGPENVYIFIIGDSFDDTKGALMDLGLELKKLGIERSIELASNNTPGGS